MSKKLQRKSFRKCVLANIRDTTIISQKPYTQVTIVVSDESGVDGSFFSPAREFHGFSKCNAGDAWDAELGYKIAYARAVREAVNWMEYRTSIDELLDNAGAAIEAEVDSIINRTPSPSSKKAWQELCEKKPIGIALGNDDVLVRGTIVFDSDLATTARISSGDDSTTWVLNF